MFIDRISVTSIDSCSDMARALQCLILTAFDPAYTGIYADSDPGDADRDRAVEPKDAAFIVIDQSSSSEWRVTITDGDSPRPVQVSEGGRRLVALGQKIGMDRAVAVLEGTDALTEDERFILRFVRNAGLSPDVVVRRLVPDAVQVPVAEPPPDDDDATIARLTARLVARGGKPLLIESLATALQTELTGGPDYDDPAIEREHAEVTAIAEAAGSRRVAEA